MTKLKLALLAGALITTGAVVAISAPGPHGERGMLGGMRGWLHPRSMTADEYDTRTRERFARLDRNSDGVLDSAEIEAAVRDQFGHGRKDAESREARGASAFLRRFGDKDGKVTKEAYIAEAKRRFAEMDLNNDGRITDEDLPPRLRGHGVLNSKGSPRRGGMDRMLEDLRQADVTPDGAITLDAFVAAQIKRFDSLDRNKDGVIDQSDFDMMRKEQVDYQVKRFMHHYGAGADGKVTRDQYFKVAKEQFARMDRKGEGRIEFGPAGDDSGGRRHRGGNRDEAPDVPPAPPPKN